MRLEGPLVETARGAKHLASANFNRMVRILNGLSEMTEDPAKWEMIRMAGGRVFKIPRNPKPPTEEPWDIAGYVPASKTLTLDEGDVEMHGDDGTTYVTPASMDVVLSTGANYVYVELSNIRVSPTATLKCVSAKASVVSSPKLYCKLLWNITTSAIAITAQKRYHRGNVEFTGWRAPYTP